MRPLDHTDWSMLESNCHRGDIQDVIAVAIREGLIRVVPAPNGRIRIIPLVEAPARPTTRLTTGTLGQARFVGDAVPSIRRRPGTAVSRSSS